MTTIYLIRHAEAEGNLYRRIHGHYDSLITLRGRKQIEALQKRFEGVRIDAVYSSDLYRTKATASAVAAGRPLDVHLTERLREVGLGAWEDLTWGEVERFEPDQLEYFNNDPLRWKIDGGESFYHLQNRMAGIIREIAERHDGQTVAVVSHGSVIRAYLCLLLNVPPQEVRRVRHCDNTAVALLRVGDCTTELEYYGDNSHLPEDISTFAHQKWWKENTTFDSTNLRFVPFDLVNDAGRYLDYRSEALESNVDDDAGLIRQKKGWLENAKKHAAAHSRAVSLALIGDTPVGMIELDTKAGADEKLGVIEFFYMIPQQRRMGMTVQLLGQAVSVYRPLGREKLQTAVSVINEQAMRFCEKYGFDRTVEKDTEGIRQYVMEMDIALRQQ
jgi:probable phosphoglycerate mutase